MAGLLPQPRVSAQSYFFTAVFMFSLVNIDCVGGSWTKNCPNFFDLNAMQEYILVVPIPTVLPWSLSPSQRCYRWLCPHPRSITITSVPVTVVLPLSPSPCSSLMPYSAQSFITHVVGLFIEDEFSDIASAKDNRELVDSRENQLLSKDEICNLREQGVTGEARHCWLSFMQMLHCVMIGQNVTLCCHLGIVFCHMLCCNECSNKLVDKQQR